MIEYLSLHDLGIIRSAQIELEPGLTVLTGETGAGKTMVLSALDLLLGGKTATGLATSAQTRVQGGFHLRADHPVLERVIEAGGEAVDGELIVTRTVPQGGRSRSIAGGVAVPQSLLSEIGEQLVAVHGQSEQALLRKESVQRDMLDRFGGDVLADALLRYAIDYREVRRLDEAVRDAVSGAADRAQESERLRAALGQIEEVAPEPDEDVSLAQRAAILGNAAEIHAAVGSAVTVLTGDSDGQDSLIGSAAVAKRALESAASLDPALAELAARLAEISMLSNELAIDLSSYLTGLESSPGELQAVETRRSQIVALTRQHGPTVADLLDWSKRAAARVFELDRANDIESLIEQRTVARAGLASLADEVTTARLAAAERLMDEVSAELAGLSMPDARIVVEVTAKPHRGEGDGLELPGEAEPVVFGPHGVDEVRLLLAANRGAAPADISKAASGGELSRVMLALEVVLASQASAPTFVFDEVDAGVGGKAAVEIGRRLARLGRTAQVIVVTHLPQVAAFADHHLYVSKQDDGQVTVSDVRMLSPEDRVRELARMLAGQEESAHAAAHASELLDLAGRERAQAANAVGSPR